MFGRGFIPVLELINELLLAIHAFIDRKTDSESPR